MKTPTHFTELETMYQARFGRALQTARRMLGKRQRQTAFHLNMTPQRLSRIERGLVNATAVEAYQLTTYLGITFEDLFTGVYGL